MSIKEFLGDTDFYKKLLTLAVPIALQNLLAASLNFVDNIMIGQMGDIPIAAVGQANRLFFMFILFMFGLTSGASIFTAQYWGKKDITNVKRVLGLTLINTVFIGLVFTVLAVAFPRQMMSLFSEDPEVIKLGITYMTITGFSYMLGGISTAYSFSMRSTESVKLPLIVGFVSLAINTFLNWILIFGNLGMPAMGVKGAAIATLTARCIEMILLISVVYIRKLPQAGKIKEFLDLNKDFIKSFYKTVLPVVLNEGIWVIGFTIYPIVYGKISTTAVAAVNIAGTIDRISFSLFFGLSNAAGIMIGNRIGAGEEQRAFDWGKRFSIITPIIGFIIAIPLALYAGSILSLYSGISADVIYSSRLIILVFAAFTPIKVFNLLQIVGTLRSGGDTNFCLIIDIVAVWAIGVPLCILGAYLKLPIHWVVALAMSGEIMIFIATLLRFLSKKWINNLIEHPEEVEA